MDELQLYFEPIDLSILPEKFYSGQLGNTVLFHTIDNFPDYTDSDIVILSVPENRNSLSSRDTSLAGDAVRQQLYKLQNHFSGITITDLGNIRTGVTVEDTYEAVSEVLSVLLKNNVTPIILGGSQDLTYANYLSNEKRGRIINIISIDSRFDIGKSDDELSNESWLNTIIFRNPNFLFNYSNLGYQTYLVEQEAIGLMKKLFFDCTNLDFCVWNNILGSSSQEKFNRYISNKQSGSNSWSDYEAC